MLRYPSAFRGEPPLPYANFILIKAKMGKPDLKISVSVSLPLGEGGKDKREEGKGKREEREKNAECRMQNAELRKGGRGHDVPSAH